MGNGRYLLDLFERKGGCETLQNYRTQIRLDVNQVSRRAYCKGDELEVLDRIY